MKRIVALALLCLCCTAGAQPVWKQDDNRSLELADGEKVLARFNLSAAPLDPHFEVLATADGRNTVWVAPPDHVWHYGLWFSWKKINGVNFWETDRETRRQQGLNRIHQAKISSEPDAATATLRYLERSHPDPQGLPVLEDAVEIRIHKPQGDAGVKVEWNIKTTALANVVLERTPPPGEPGGKGWGGYGGFSWRGAEDFKEVRFSDSEGRVGEAIHRQQACWLAVSGMLAQRKAGLLIVPHPQNPRQPSSWYLSSVVKLPFWYANPALLQDAPLKLAKGESFHHRYLVVVNNGGWSAERCGKEAAAYVAGK